jgi:hypothetical protein
VWGFEFTTQVNALQGDSAETAATLNVKYKFGGAWLLVACYRFPETAEPSPLLESIWTFEKKIESTSKEICSGILTRQFGSSEIVLILRGEIRAIASIGCEGEKRAIASSMSPHAPPRHGPTPIFSAATAGGITTVQTASAAAKALPTTPTRERQKAAGVKGCCTDREIFTLLRCTTDELFFSCCDSVAAHFKHAATSA